MTHLLDLPDEILFLILRYCFEDMDFLLWSCPIIKTENQFCHDCYHCSLCHGSLSQDNRKRLDLISPSSNNATRTRKTVSGSSINTSNRSNCTRSGSSRLWDTSNCNSPNNSNPINNVTSDTILRKQRRRTFAKEDQQVKLNCPQDRNQSCGCDQQHHYPLTLENNSFWSRRFARFSFRSRRHIYPCHSSSSHSIPRVIHLSSLRSDPPTRLPSTPPHSHRLQHRNWLPDSNASEATPEIEARASPSIGTLLPITFLESLPLPQTQPNHAPLQREDCSKGSSEIQHVKKEDVNTNSLPPLLPHAARRRPRSKGMRSSAINRSRSPSPLGGDVSELDYHGIKAGEANGNALRRSTPFQLLLVNKRLANMVVQLLWSATVFHGHDVSQMESLISTLYKDSSFDSPSESAISSPGIFQELDYMYQGKDTTSKLCTTTGELCRDGAAPYMGSSFTMQRSSTRTIQKTSQPYVNKTECYQASRPSERIGVHQRDQKGSENYITSIKGGSASVRGANSCRKHPNMRAGVFPRRSHCVAEPLCRCIGKDTALWSYRQLVKRVVLNFAHPQASPQLLVRALECISSRCRNQIQALDLHANEKMQAAGLETSSELERLFGSGFSKLRYLRLQGGFVDNQLFGALIKGLSTSSMTPCHLSQVFLGPGSVTDSAIDKLIAVAGHSLEVFAVTSCVDVSGGALANLLTRCPKLRVLSVHRSLAKDKELLEGLGIELEDGLSLPSTVSALSAPSPNASSRKPIIAPLERLELGTVKLTEIGVTEIVKGTCLTLRFLVLEMQHFKNDFLKCAIAPLCRLEGLYFVEPDLVPQHPRQQQVLQDPLQEEQRPRRWFFDFRRGRRTLEAQQQQHHHHQFQHHGLQSSDRHTPEHHGHTGHSLSYSGPAPRQSPWLGETSTDEWVQYGNCALWATSTVGSSVSPRIGRNRDTNTENLLINQSRARSFTAYFRAISRRLVSMLSSNGNNAALDLNLPAGPENPADVTTDPLSSIVAENEYESLLERFGVDPKTIEAVLLSLQPSLKVFTAMETNIIRAALEVPEETAITSSSDMVLSYDVVQRDRLETFLRLIVLLGALVFGAAMSVSAA